MDIDFSKALQGFDEIWNRVQQQKSKDVKKSAAAPSRKNQSRARRFNPGRR